MKTKKIIRLLLDTIIVLIGVIINSLMYILITLFLFVITNNSNLSKTIGLLIVMSLTMLSTFKIINNRYNTKK